MSDESDVRLPGTVASSLSGPFTKILLRHRKSSIWWWITVAVVSCFFGLRKIVDFHRFEQILYYKGYFVSRYNVAKSSIVCCGNCFGTASATHTWYYISRFEAGEYIAGLGRSRSADGFRSFERSSHGCWCSWRDQDILWDTRISGSWDIGKQRTWKGIFLRLCEWNFMDIEGKFL